MGQRIRFAFEPPEEAWESVGVMILRGGAGVGASPHPWAPGEGGWGVVEPGCGVKDGWSNGPEAVAPGVLGELGAGAPGDGLPRGGCVGMADIANVRLRAAGLRWNWGQALTG